MKKWIALSILYSLSLVLRAENLSGFFSFCSFDVPDQKPYLETYLNVTGSSVKFIPIKDSLLQGQLEVRLIIRSGEKIVYFDKYNLKSPVISASEANPDFLDQQRMTLDTGTYELELALRDKNTNAAESIMKQSVRIGYPTDTISISDIELIDSFKKSDTTGKFSKSGYEMIPFVNANMFYPKEITNLKFYSEIYRSDKLIPKEDYLLRYFITNSDTKRLLENYIISIKQKPQPVNVVMGDINIQNLYSGNYYLCIEIRNKKNQLLALKTLFFQRSNPENKPMVTDDIMATNITNTFIAQINNPDTLVEYISRLYPISSGMETELGENMINHKEVHAMQQYLYFFWSRRNPTDPGEAFSNYNIEVKKADVAFRTQIKRGYETDRGRVYLQYGPPNIISENNDVPDAYPYEIWQYYKLKDQSNRKFVFYARERSSNEYILLHSDAIGEITNPNWQTKIQAGTGTGPSLDPATPIQRYGNHSEDNYVNPR